MRTQPLIFLAVVFSALAGLAGAADPAGKTTAQVSACRVSNETLQKLGFDWMVRPPSAPVQAGQTVSAGSPAGPVRRAGSLVPVQYELIKLALRKEAGAEWKDLPPAEVGDEVRIRAPWERGREAFMLDLKAEPGGLAVSLRGAEPPESIFINGGQVLLYVTPAAEAGTWKLYFVSIYGIETSMSLDQAEGEAKKQPAIWIEAHCVEISEAGYDRHEAELEKAVGLCDLKRLTTAFAGEGLDVKSLPRVSLRSGRRATISVIREFRYPVEYQEEGSRLTPSRFDLANVGVELTVGPTLAEGEIRLDGQLVLRVFKGFTRSEAGTFAPTFQTTEANFWRVLKNGQSAGFWLPGTCEIRRSPGFDALTNFSVAAQAGSLSPDEVRTKVALLITARRDTEEAPLATAAPIQVRAYDVTKSTMGRNGMKQIQHRDLSSGLALAAVVEESDAVPSEAVELPVTEDPEGRFRFATSRAADCLIRRAPAPAYAEISVWPADREAKAGAKRMSTATVQIRDGTKVLLAAPDRKDARGEAVLVVFQKKTADREGGQEGPKN